MVERRIARDERGERERGTRFHEELRAVYKWATLSRTTDKIL